MGKRERIVGVTVLFLVVISILSITVYPRLPQTAQTTFFFYLLVVSAWTSLAGCFWALYSVAKFYGELDKAKKEVYSRLGADFVGRLADLIRHAEERFKRLTPSEQEKLMSLALRGIDLAFNRLEHLVKPPRKKRVKFV